MADVEPTLAELIRRALESRIAQVRVSMPGKVVDYDPATKTATVQPCLADVLFDDDDNRVTKELQPIQNVPVVFPGGAALDQHIVLTADDTGDLVFATNSINDWKASGNVAAPGDLRLHPLGSAKFYPGLRHSGNVPPDTDNSIGEPGGTRARFADGVMHVSSTPTGGDNVVLAGDATAGLAKLLSDVLNAGVTAGGPGAANFTAALAVLTPLLVGPGVPLWLEAVASSKLKADP